MKKITKLKRILFEKGVTQKDLADITNMENCQISNIVSGNQKNIMLDSAKKIAKALGVTLDDAFGDD